MYFAHGVAEVLDIRFESCCWTECHFHFCGFVSGVAGVGVDLSVLLVVPWWMAGFASSIVVNTLVGGGGGAGGVLRRRRLPVVVVWWWGGR